MSSYVGWELDKEDRERLLACFIPVYPDVIAHHVTLHRGKGDVPDEVEAKIVGYANDGQGVEAFVVAINGETMRPDGRTYHITWSIDRESGRKPAHSNDVIKNQLWVGFPETIAIRVHPKQFS